MTSALTLPRRRCGARRGAVAISVCALSLWLQARRPGFDHSESSLTDGTSSKKKGKIAQKSEEDLISSSERGEW